MAFQPDQIIIGANDDGTPTGEYFPRVAGHTGKGRRHFAVSYFIVNSKGQLLLQLRKHKIYDNIWDTTGSTHQLHSPNGYNETDEEATDRSFVIEYGVNEGSVQWKKWGGFNYFAQYGSLCENEHDIVLTGQYEGGIKLNPEEAYSCKWVDKSKFLKDIEASPSSYTPWAVGAVKLLKEKGFFDSTSQT